MRQFRTGNVIKTKTGYIWIVTRVNETREKYDLVSFSHSNMSGRMPFTTQEKEEMCFCGEGAYFKHDCEDCHGTGQQKIEYPGADQAEFLAENVKDYIKKCLFKNFDFN